MWLSWLLLWLSWLFLAFVAFGTTLWSIIAAHYPRLVQEIESAGSNLPRFVRQEFKDYLQYGLLEYSFLLKGALT